MILEIRNSITKLVTFTMATKLMFFYYTFSMICYINMDCNIYKNKKVQLFRGKVVLATFIRYTLL